MKLFNKIANRMEKASQSGFDLEEHYQISQEIDNEIEKIVLFIQSATDETDPKELLSKTWDLLHATFFLMTFSQPDPKRALEDALSEFEPKIKNIDKKSMGNLERKSFNEFKRIIDISRRLIGRS